MPDVVVDVEARHGGVDARAASGVEAATVGLGQRPELPFGDHARGERRVDQGGRQPAEQGHEEEKQRHQHRDLALRTARGKSSSATRRGARGRRRAVAQACVARAPAVEDRVRAGGESLQVVDERGAAYRAARAWARSAQASR